MLTHVALENAMIKNDVPKMIGTIKVSLQLSSLIQSRRFRSTTFRSRSAFSSAAPTTTGHHSRTTTPSSKSLHPKHSILSRLMCLWSPMSACMWVFAFAPLNQLMFRTRSLNFASATSWATGKSTGTRTRARTTSWAAKSRSKWSHHRLPHR